MEKEKQYITPKIEITEFAAEDVITTSGSEYNPGEGQSGFEE